MTKITAVFTLAALVCLWGAPGAVLAGEDLQVRTFKYFLDRAGQGDKNAQFIVGNRYESGNGTEQNIEMAYEWYAKAAALGHEVAQYKLSLRGKGAAAGANAAPSAPAAVKPAAAQKPRQPDAPPQVAQSRPAPKPRPVAVSQAPAARPAIRHSNVDARKTVLDGGWTENNRASEFLPSAATNCAPVGEGEIVCFSEALEGSVGRAAVTYTVKSTLTRFEKDGSFIIKYLYNLVEVDKDGAAGKAMYKLHDQNIPLKEGWQPSSNTLECKASTERFLVCKKDKRTLQFSRR